VFSTKIDKSWIVIRVGLLSMPVAEGLWRTRPLARAVHDGLEVERGKGNLHVR
jgi:hypothetical protein